MVNISSEASDLIYRDQLAIVILVYEAAKSRLLFIIIERG